MSVVNRFMISGNLTSDPYQSVLPDGTNVVRITVAQNTYRKNRDSEGFTEYVQFVSASSVGFSADKILRMNLVKGERVFVEGTIRVKETTEGDKKVSTVFLNIDNIDHIRRALTESSTASQEQSSTYGDTEDEDAPF